MFTAEYYIWIPLGYLMKGCWLLVKNYGIAILLFTLLTKVVLLPVSVWIQKNSIQMVKIQPQVNFLKANYQGNIDLIAEEQAKLYKKEHYHPLLSIIPLILQIVLLLGVVYIIYHPLSYLFLQDEELVLKLAEYIGADTGDSSWQIRIIEAVKSGVITSETAIDGISPEKLAAAIGEIKEFKLTFLGMNLASQPSEVWGWYVLVPVFAGLSSWLMCFTQNLANVLQKEQGKLNKYGVMTVSVILSLYLGLFVPSGIALYWIASNLMSIAQMYLLNLAINPKKYVDYEMLEESRLALSKAKAFGKVDKKDPLYKEMRRREKQDYKRFKNIVNKHLVIYSEKSGFYKYFKDVIEELLNSSNIVIHYVTNDYNDAVFKLAETQPRIKPYYIGLKKTAVLMMLVECDMFLMTTPDLDNYYLKRSYMKKDIEYVYIPHDTMSAHTGFNEGAFDNFDTMFCCGGHFAEEIRATEKLRGTKEKTLVEFGFPLLDELVSNFEKVDKETAEKKQVLIAPSWQEDNILDSCIDELIENLYKEDLKIIVRPHPEYVKRFGFQLNKLVEKYAGYDGEKLVFELDFSSNKSVYSSDVLITDWSGIAAEFSFATRRPAVYINTKMKCLNENWEKINLTPVEITLRNELGIAVDKDKLGGIGGILKTLSDNGEEYAAKIENYFKDFTYNHGCAGKKGAEYILKSLSEKRNLNKNEKKEKKND